MISNYEFLALNENEQAEVAWNGIFLGNRDENNFRILLYRVNDFYAEIFYNNTSNNIERIRSFKTLKLLSPYLKLDLSR